jgi:competence protein ComGC
VNPSLAEPPPIDGEAGYGLIEALVVIFLVLVILLVLLRF